MGWITVNDLLNYYPIHQDSAASWADFLAGVEQNAAFLQKNVTEPVGSAWTGTAAELATGKFNAKQAGLLKPTTNIKEIQTTLEDFSTKMSTYAEDMKTAIQINAVGMVVTADGTVTPAPGSKATADQCAIVQNQIKAILDQATSLDQQTAKTLNGLLPEPADFAASPVAQPATVQKWSATVGNEGSLWQIAEKYYGDGSKWTLIYNDPDNKKKIGANPNLIYKGMKLTIPPLAGVLGTPGGQIANPDGTVTGPAKAPAAAAGSGTPAGASPAASSIPAGDSYDPTTGTYYGDSFTPPPGVSQAQWGAS